MRKLVRRFGVASAAVAFGAGSALAAPGAGAQSELPGGSPGADPCGETVVTPDTLDAEGWFTPDDETPATIAAVDGAPETVGDAALTLPTDDDLGSSLYKDVDRVPLGELLVAEGGEPEALSYEYTSEGQAPALQIRLHEASLAESESENAGYDLGFATIVWSPEPAEGWSTADPGDSGDFWVTRALDDPEGEEVPRGERMTLEEIIELNPEAVVTEYGVQKTRDNTAENVAIDNFTLGCETTNFELEEADDPEGSLEDLTGSLEDVLPS